jgi:3-dehydroquinate synthase
MIKKLKTVYKKEDEIEFIIDDDTRMSWMANFDSSGFERFFVIIDEDVSSAWGNLVLGQLKKHGKEVIVLSVKAKEYSKSLAYYPKVIGFLEKHKCNLFDLVIGIGGGIIMDLAGFTCSTYMRGLKMYLIPTTIMGQADASSAGKTCLNTKNGKNTLGTFYYPLKVYNNINFLRTNSGYHLRQGFSEVFKYGLLGSGKLIHLMEKYSENKSGKALAEVIELTTLVRIAIRKKNALASNLGHTFGHAMEKLSGFKMLHGDAITAGTVMALHFSMKIGIMKKKDAEQIMARMKSLGLNIFIEKGIDVKKMVDLMMRDKKSSSRHVNLVLIRGIEKPYEDNGFPFHKTDPKVLEKFLRNFLKSYKYQVKGCADFIRRDKIEYQE